MKKKKFTRQIWTDEEVERLREIYPTSTKSEMEEAFGRSARKIYCKANSLGIKKTREVILRQAKESWETRADHPGKKYHFKKGGTPFNKGLKQSEYMSKKSIERSSATRFKKGQKPQNWRPVGSTRVDTDGYILIKTKEPDVFELQHRVVWEQHNGPIPEGYNIQFKDGNRANCDIDNLYKISRKEQIMLNHGPNNLPDNLVAMYLSGGKHSTPEGRETMLAVPELIQLKRNQLLLSRQIKKITQNEES